MTPWLVCLLEGIWIKASEEAAAPLEEWIIFRWLKLNLQYKKCEFHIFF